MFRLSLRPKIVQLFNLDNLVYYTNNVLIIIYKEPHIYQKLQLFTLLIIFYNNYYFVINTINF